MKSASRVSGYAGVCLICVALLFAAIVQAAAQQTLRVNVDLVNVVLTVQDSAGRFVSGLSADDFHIYEDGQEQKISAFEKQDVGSAVGILLDNSLSMTDILPMMKTGLLDFAQHTQSFDELFVMTFGTRVRTIHDIGEPLGQLQSNVKALGAQGVSVVFDALVEGLQKVSARDSERKALLVFTDGIDTASKAGFRDVLLEAQKAGALLYFIPIGTRVSSRAASILIDEHTLDSLAKETGGRVVYLSRSEPVRPVMESIREELARQYYIGYYTTRRPGFHSIKVEVPGRDLTIRAKRGYYTP
jgi:Ca-activated chloride channel family protein